VAQSKALERQWAEPGGGVKSARKILGFRGKNPRRQQHFGAQSKISFAASGLAVASNAPRLEISWGQKTNPAAKQPVRRPVHAVLQIGRDSWVAPLFSTQPALLEPALYNVLARAADYVFVALPNVCTVGEKFIAVSNQ
jgi:hypothetical protein